jgi:hypothetical protein
MTQPAPKPAPVVTTRARRRALATPAWLRRVRYWFSPENLKEFAGTLALVVPLTVLIWIWAEREQSKDDELQFTVDVRARNPNKIVTLAGNGSDDAAARPRPQPVVVRISGPKVGVDAIREQIASDRSKAQITLEVPDDFEDNGTRDVAVQPLLDQQAIFRDTGITVKSTEPDTVKVRSDAIAYVELTPTLPAELAARVDALVTQPAKVRVRGAAQTLPRLEGKLRAELDLSAYPGLRDAQPGTTSRPLDNVPIKPIDIAGVTLETTTVNGVTLTFSQAREDVLASVVVNVTQPVTLGARVRFEPTNLLNVRISGPPDLLRQVAMAKDEDRPYAEVRVTRADLGKSFNRPPVFRNLPEGVRVLDPNATPIHVEVDAATDESR